MRVCSVSYSAYKAHAPCFILICGLFGSTIYFHVFHKRYDSRGKKLLRIRCFWIIIIIIIKDWTLWSFPSPNLQLLSPTFLRSSNCSPSLWSVVVWFQRDSVLWHSLQVLKAVPSLFWISLQHLTETLLIQRKIQWDITNAHGYCQILMELQFSLSCQILGKAKIFSTDFRKIHR